MAVDQQSARGLLAPPQQSTGKLRPLWRSGTGRPPVQVPQQFFVNVTGKPSTPVARSMAREVVNNDAAWIHEATTADSVTPVIDIAGMAQTRFWDASILASAEQADATLIDSEDLDAGQTIAGDVMGNLLADR